MKDKISKKRKKYAVALLAATAATVATSFSPSAPWVMASETASGENNPNLPHDFNPPTYTEVPFDPNAVALNIPYYHVEAGNNVSVTTNTFTADDGTGNVNATFNNFIVKANDTLVEDSDDIVVDKGNSENPEKGTENGVTRKYKLKLSETLKNELKASAGGGGAAPSKLADGTNTTVSGDGTDGNKYTVNVKPDLTGITSITGDTLTLHGGTTAVTIGNDGVNVGGKKITNLADAALTGSSTDAVTGKQLHATNEKVEGKLDKTAERHIKPQAYTVENGTVTLTYVDGDGKDVAGKATITGLNPVKSVASGDESKLTVANNNGAITVTPVVAADVTATGDANKLATAGVVNTAINNATNPLANKNLSNITDDGKKVITGLGTEVVQGDGVTVTPNEDATTGKKTYTISAVKPNFANGTNTTVDGDGTKDKPYKYNVNPALTGITSITGDTGLTFTGAGKTITINGDGVNVGGAKVTNLADAALTNSSTDAVTGKQLNATNEKVEGKVDKTAERHIKAQAYTVENGTVTLHYVDAEGKDKSETATISGLNPVKSVTSGDANTLTVANNDGAITVTPVVATNVTDAGNANKLTTASVVNTAINNATSPLANKALSNITDDGKKVITGLGTEVVQGDGVTVTHTEDGTGKKTYTVSAVKPNFDKGTNTTVQGDGTANNPYKYNVNPALTGIASITGDTGLTFTGAGTTVTINAAGVNVGGAKVTNLADGAVNSSSTDAVTGKQLDATNTKVTNLETNKLDKTAERHIKAQAYTVENGTVTLHYVDGEGKDKSETATITGLNPVKSVASGNENTLTVDNNDGAITLTPVVATNVTDSGNVNKLVTAGVVNTAINNATSPLANKSLSNITDAGKKVITGLGTAVVQGNGITVTSNEDATTGKKTYTISATAVQPIFANGTNTTVEGDGTAAKPYKYNVNPALTGITSITNVAPVDPTQPDAAKVASTTLTIDGNALTVENKQADGTTKTTVTIGKDGINAGGKTITNVANPTGDKDAANKEYVDAQKWGLKVQNGTAAAEDVTPNTGKITLKTGTDTSDDATKPKKGIVIAKDDQGNITLGLEKADRTILDNAANVGNTGSDGRDGKAGKDANGVVAGSAGTQGPTGKDGLNGKDLTNKVNALRNGEAGTVVYTNAAGDRLVKANDGQYYKADEVEPNGEKKPGATAVPTKDVIASLVSPNGTTTGAATKLSNIADGAISATSKDAVNGSQLFKERETSPVIFVDKDGHQVFKNADGEFVTKAGAKITDADELTKIHTKVNAANPMTLDNVASAVNNLTGTTYLDKLAEGVKADNKVANSAVNVTDLHAATTAILDKPITFIGDNDTNDKIERKLGETLKIHGVNNITVTKDATNADTLNVALKSDLTGITSITNATTADGAGTKLTIDGDKVSIANKQAAGTTKTITIGKDGINADGTKITNVATPEDKKDAANKEYVDAQKWGLKVQNGDNPAEAVTAKDKAITLKTSADISDAADKPKKGIVIAKDDQGNITLGLEKADRTTLDNAANVGNTGSDGRDGQAGKNATGVVAGSAGAQGPTGKDGLNGKDLTSKVNALRNGEAGTVVYTNAAGDRLVKANDGQYYKADEVEPNGEKKQGATAVPTKDVIASLVSPNGTTTGATTKLSNVADGAISATSKDAVNGSQLFKERETSPVIFVDKDGNQVFKTADNKFVTKAGAEITDTNELAKIHTKVNAANSMTLDNVASAVNNLTGTTYLDKLAEGVKADNKVANSAVNVTDLHAATTAILDKPITFIGDNDTNDKIERKLGETLKIHGVNNITVTKDATNADTLNVALKSDLTGITSITNATTADGAGTKLTIDGDKVSIANKQAAGTTKTITIGKDGINADGTKITNVATPTDKADAANKEYVDAQKWGLKVQNGTDAAEDVTPNTGKITLKTGTDTSDDATKPKKGIVIAKDDQGNITLGLEKADRTTLDNAANVGNTSSDGRDGQAGKNATGVVAGSAGAQGPTGQDGLNGKDLTSKVNALRNGEAGTVVYTNAAGDRLVKANDGNYYKADEVEPNGEKKQGATAVPTKDVIASLVSPNGTTTGATTKLSNIADGAISITSKDAVNGSQLFKERETSPVIFVDKDGNQVFKTADGKFVTKAGTAVADADLDKVHTKVNAAKAMTLDNVASAVNNLTGTTYLDKLAEGAKADSKVANSAVNVTDLHAATTAILNKPITFIGDNDTNDKIERKLGETLKIHGVNNITVTKDATNADTLNVALKSDLTGITSITNATTADGAGTKLTIDGNALTVENKQADGTTKTTVTIGKDGINAGGKTITNVADPTGAKDAANKDYVDAQKWGLKVQNGTDAAADVTPANKVVTFKTGTGTVAPVNLPAGQDSPTKDTDNVAPKKGIVLETDNQGNVTIGLEKADRTTLDHAANIGNTGSDGRDGQAGAGKNGATVAGTAGAQGPTGKDGLNGKDLTSKVNALRNGEAGTVVYTNAAGDRVVKANDGKYYKADEVKPDGNVKTDAENGGTAPVAVTPEARLVSPDGTVTNGTTVLNNISSVVTPLAGTDTLEKLKEAAKDNSPVKNAATNVTDLHNTANAIVEKGLTFKGNAGDKIHKNLGDQLDIVGEGTVAADATTAANNIRTNNVNGKLEIGLVDKLTNITSITAKDGQNGITITSPGNGTDTAKTELKVTNEATTFTHVEPGQGDVKDRTTTVTIGKDGINAGGKTITNVADPTNDSDAATKKYVDDQAWSLHVDDGTGTGTAVAPKNKVITFKAGTGTIAPTNLPAGKDSPTKDTDGLTPKTGVVVETDKNGTITIGLEETARKTLANAANIGNTGSDGRDGKAGKDATGVVAGSAGAQGPTGKDGLNGKDLTSKVNALRNGEAGTVVFTNAAGERLVKANDGNYYKADQVEPNGAPKAGATAVPTKDVVTSLVSPDGTTTGATTKLSNIADGTVSATSKDAVNGSQLFKERETTPTIFVDKDGNQVFKTTDGKFVDKNGAEVPAADTDKIHTKLNAGAPMTLDNVASALGKPAEGIDYLAKLKEAKEGTTVNNSAVNVTDLHNTANAIVEKGLSFEGDTANDTVKRKLGETLKIHGDNNITVTKDATNKDADTLKVALQPTLTGITSITNASTADGAGTKLTIDGDKVSIANKQADGATKTITIGKDGIDAGGTNITNAAGITLTPATPGGASVSLTSTGLDNGGNRITNVAAGVNDTDAVNVAQLKGIVNVVGDVNSRINRSSAQSAALAGLQTLQYDPLEPTQISAGLGYYKGATALALGVGHYKNESTLFHVGASVNGHKDEVMANASVTWKFGSRAAESAVKDTYRQGPISASYTLQDKVSALEEQNQLQSEKINAQNQVIEDLKAQLAEVLKYIRK